MVNKFLRNIKKNQNDTLFFQKKLISMLREYFNLRVQLKMGRLKQLHLLQKLRRNIAAFKFYLSQNKNIYKK